MSETLVHEVPHPVGTALCLHGIGFGPWLFEPWAGHFAAAGLRMVAPTLPGHGDGADPSLDDVVRAVEGILDGIEGPVTLVGHSFGGLVAQIIAARRELHALVLICPLVPGQVRLVPSLRGIATLVPRFLAGRPLAVPYSLYRRLGLHALDEDHARSLFDRIVPWPNRLTRDLLHRPVVDPTAVRAPVLVAMGKEDRLLPWRTVRVLGDLYEAVVWRYDDLGHMPMFEPNGDRMGRDVAGFAANPRRLQVIESEAFSPDEGVGHELRRQRRGEAMKQRSAYGQRASAREKA